LMYFRRLKRGHVIEHVSRPAQPTHVVQPGLAALGIAQPSPIQAAAMPRLLAGSNAAIQSYTGSGKVSYTGSGKVSAAQCGVH
jgi:superfamily II DNA/RNA helicase